MMRIFIVLISLPIVLGVLQMFQWQPIPQDVITFLHQVMDIVRYTNKYFPVLLLLQYVQYVIIIEIVIYTYNLFERIRTGITGGEPFFTFGRFGGLADPDEIKKENQSPGNF